MESNEYLNALIWLVEHCKTKEVDLNTVGNFDYAINTLKTACQNAAAYDKIRQESETTETKPITKTKK